jgi:hypothetical protein
VDFLISNVIVLVVAYLGARGLRNGILLGAAGLFFLFWIGMLFVLPDNAHIAFKISFGIGIALSFMKGKHIPDRFMRTVRSRANRSIRIDFTDYIKKNENIIKYTVKSSPYSVTAISVDFYDSLFEIEKLSKNKVKSDIRTQGARQRTAYVSYLIGAIIFGLTFYFVHDYVVSPDFKSISMDKNDIDFGYYFGMFIMSLAPASLPVIVEEYILVSGSEINSQYLSFENALNEHCKTLLQDEVAKKQTELAQQAADERREAHQRQLEIEREKTKRAEIAAQEKQHEMEKKRPAKAEALDSILSKLDEI